MRISRFFNPVGLALAIAGCASPDLGLLRDPKTGHPIPEQFQGSKAMVTELRALAIPAVLVEVESASLPGSDRLVFTFAGKNVPAYQFVYKKQGAPALFEMRFGARATLANAKPSIPQPMQQRHLNYPTVKAISQTRVAEEAVFWNAELARESEFRVTELLNPPRIVVDFKR